ncbi:Hypothetical protein CINCED_3A021722 [Cinara cedri]|uniref:Uncharacterized protein n=1 Tax=Cinara cedri TaxID=506608 RepID=A0A5E4N6A4_9HEMI|nr:Hypothetical protein CINCED_3A021722 [Cinara cedri]
MPKRRCVFAPNLKSEFPFLKDADEVGKVFCTICKSVFSKEHGGLSDIKQHTTKVKKHLLALSAASKNEKELINAKRADSWFHGLTMHCMSTSSAEPGRRARLASISLPKFEGDIKERESFFDYYMVHDAQWSGNEI